MVQKRWRSYVKPILFAVFAGGISCSAPVKKQGLPVTSVINGRVTGSQQEKPDNVPAADTIKKQPDMVSVEMWPGKTFIVLDKQKMFFHFGYELYLNRELESSKAPVDNSWETSKHRILCNKLTGHELIVNSVEQTGDEWLVTFTDIESGKIIYGKTHKSAIKEVVFKSDIEWATKRWLNQVVFSRKGLMSAVADGNNGYISHKVRIQDSLKVFMVTPGVTPLPVNQVWLHVQTPLGIKGFVPVQCSWTNVMIDRVRESHPWGDEILEADPTVTYSWDESIWEIINNHRIVIEMTREQVLLSWGEPLERIEKLWDGINRECWFYGSHELYFNKSALIGMAERILSN